MPSVVITRYNFFRIFLFEVNFVEFAAVNYRGVISRQNGGYLSEKCAISAWEKSVPLQ